VVSVGDVVRVGERRLRVMGKRGETSIVGRDCRGRIAVRNVVTQRLSYLPEPVIRRATVEPANNDTMDTGSDNFWLEMTAREAELENRPELALRIRSLKS